MSVQEKRRIEILLAHCSSPAEAGKIVPELLGRARPRDCSLRGLRVLVKPNLLRAVPLACADPLVTAAACAWLLGQGASVTVADSPGFGTARGVAAAIGLEAALKPLGLAVRPFTAGPAVRFSSGRRVVLAKEALEADRILSVGKFKAHSQMLLTLSCKNLYGTVPGLRKALYHGREGQCRREFEDMQAEILEHLPPVSGMVDGITAMHVTGPSGCRPFPLHLIGASSSPVALDEALCAVAGLSPGNVPLSSAFMRRHCPDCASEGAEYVFPLCAPRDFDATGFRVPDMLITTSFRPLRLMKSCLKRVWMDVFR